MKKILSNGSERTKPLTYIQNWQRWRVGSMLTLPSGKLKTGLSDSLTLGYRVRKTVGVLRRYKAIPQSQYVRDQIWTILQT